MTFRELAIKGAEILAKQKPVTLEQAREQVRHVKERSERTIKKQRPLPDSD